MSEGVRIDKWLWAARIFKTRSIAADEVKKKHVLCGGQPVKPSRTVAVGEVYDVRKPPIIRSYKVLSAADKRVGAKLAADIVLDVTPDEELRRLEMLRLGADGMRDPGTGRPTKRERRDLDGFLDDDLSLNYSDLYNDETDNSDFDDEEEA